MKPVSIFALTIAITFPTSSLLAADLMEVAQDRRDWLILMNSDAEYVKSSAGEELRIIRNPNDFTAFIADVTKDKSHPLSDVPKENLFKFTSGIRFGKSGIANLELDPIMDHISHSDYVNLIERFGLSEILASNEKGYRCASAGTMTTSSFTICTSNCYAIFDESLIGNGLGGLVTPDLTQVSMTAFGEAFTGDADMLIKSWMTQ